MKEIQELQRLFSPSPKPQSLAWDGSSLWMGSLATKRIFQIDTETWSVKNEAPTPGSPWGMTYLGNEFRILCGETSEDYRILRRFTPETGFDPDYKLPCPDDTGSQLGYDGQRLHLSQWYNQRVLALTETGQIESSIPLPHQPCGQVIVEDRIYLITTDDEDTDCYYLTRVDLGSPEPKIDDLAHVPFPARALAFDGESFWTNHRAADQIVRFKLPD